MTHSIIPLVDTDGSHQDHRKKWQEILSDLITDPKELVQVLQLDAAQKPASLAAMNQFPLKVTRSFVDSIRIADWNDPLLRQIWPAQEEELEVSGYIADPLAEQQSNPVPGLLHKYQSRVLLTAAPHCAIHCRYCFRRHFDYKENSPNRLQWQQALNYIAHDHSIEEVILSGGDPLAVSDRQFDWLLSELEQISHVNTVRIHSRMPIVLPERLTPELLTRMEHSHLSIVLVMHCNHSQEIAPAVAEALSKIDANTVTLLNQSVLLANVNDNCQTLTDLSKKLFALNVLPYYLHLPDQVAGTAHFTVSRQKGLALIKAMEAQLPGYLVPQLVQEEPGMPAKTRVS